MTSLLTPPISAPFPSARGTITYPRLIRRASISRSAAAATDSFSWNSCAPSRARHWPSAPSARWTRLAIGMWTCSCGSPSRLMWWVNRAAISPAPSRHSPVAAE